jgi:hypothetical protein
VTQPLLGTINWGPWFDWGTLILPLALSVLGVFVSIETPKLKTRLAKWCWRGGLILFGLIVSLVTWKQQGLSRASAKADRDADRSAYMEQFSKLRTALEALSRTPGATGNQTIAEAWGKVSIAEPPARPPSRVPSRQTETRRISAEDLGKELRGSLPASATVINDATVEAGTFAKQIEIGLRMGGWAVGGDNIKAGDPEFFPDALTVEVSSVPAAADDHSTQAAKNLIAALHKQNVEATLRFTELRFPPNFMRIKVAGR